MVHSISWAKDDSAVVTASADFTAKVWLLPELPGPPASGDTLSCGLTRHHSSYEYTYDRAAVLGTASAEQTAAGGVASTPGSPTRAYVARQDSSAAVLNTGVLASLGATAAAAGVGVSVLQHTSFVYAAEMHPTMQPLPTVITAGFDGVLRLWSLEGVVLYSLQVRADNLQWLAFCRLYSLLVHPKCALMPLTVADGSSSRHCND
jgi:WD40 repeat protein